MVRERTLSIIKPDAVRKKLTGKIISLFEQAGFDILAQKKMQLTKSQAERFYSVHSKRPFFGSLVDFMCSGPCIVQVLEKENAVASNRELMGATNPHDAAAGTIRKLYGTDVESNAVHGSDSLENAQIEIQFFFCEQELLSECL